MVKEILLTLMPGIVSMLVWRRLHKEQVFSALDYLEGGTVFDLAVYLANVFLIWSRNWEYVDIAAMGCSGTFKYIVSSLALAVCFPVLFAKLAAESPDRIAVQSGDSSLIPGAMQVE
ncbi:MAG: hypothetical protein HFE83_02895 [Lachnospiraceae bacterium]|nr:hypothetical protein [Lachnospiraceae bacterium]